MNDFIEFSEYERKKGVLNIDNFNAVRDHSCSDTDLGSANSLIGDFIEECGYRPEGLDGKTVEAAAKLIGAQRGDDKSRYDIPVDETGSCNVMWILTETYIMLGRDPDPLLQAGTIACMKSIAEYITRGEKGI